MEVWLLGLLIAACAAVALFVLSFLLRRACACKEARGSVAQDPGHDKRRSTWSDDAAQLMKQLGAGGKALGAPTTKEYDVFVSHCKKEARSEDRALWVVDALHEGGLHVFFDRANLREITKEQLHRDVLSSCVLVTILDPNTFDSEWVRWENEWACENGIPIQVLYDADVYRWAELSKWIEHFPEVFKLPALEYHRTYHRECKAALVGKVSALVSATGGRGTHRRPIALKHDPAHHSSAPQLPGLAKQPLSLAEATDSAASAAKAEARSGAPPRRSQSEGGLISKLWHSGSLRQSPQASPNSTLRSHDRSPRSMGSLGIATGPHATEPSPGRLGGMRSKGSNRFSLGRHSSDRQTIPLTGGAGCNSRNFSEAEEREPPAGKHDLCSSAPPSLPGGTATQAGVEWAEVLIPWEQITLGEMLGHGANASVFKATYEMCEVAVKIALSSSAAIVALSAAVAEASPGPQRQSAESTPEERSGGSAESSEQNKARRKGSALGSLQPITERRTSEVRSSDRQPDERQLVISPQAAAAAPQAAPSLVGANASCAGAERGAVAVDETVAAMREECQLMLKLRHPHVLLIMGFTTDGATKHGLVMEMMTCSLRQLLEAETAAAPLTWGRPLLRIATEVARGLAYLHLKGILHRDLKPDNVMLTEPPGLHAKVSDFGTSRQLTTGDHHDMTYTMAGTPSFIAPEVLRAERVGNESDVWSFGALLVQLATRKPPYAAVLGSAGSAHLLMSRVAQGELRPTDGVPTSVWPDEGRLAVLAEACVSHDPSDRPTFSALATELNLELNALTLAGQHGGSSPRAGGEGAPPPLLARKSSLVSSKI